MVADAYAAYNLGALGQTSTDDENKIGLIDLGGEGGPRTYTIAEFNAVTQAAARGLLAKGLRKGDRVAILSANRMEFLASYFGAMCAGMVAMPVNYRLPSATIAYILEQADVRLILCDRERRAGLPAGTPVVEFGSRAPDGFDAFLDRGDFTPFRPDPEDLALLLYTSGSTGKPKGVMISHAGYLWAIQTRLAASVYGRHRFLVAAPLYHMNALNTVKLAIGGHGAIVLLPRFTPRTYVDAIHAYRCTWLTAIPTMIALIASEPSLREGRDLSSIEMVRLGSEPLTQRIIDSARAIFPGASVGNGYGTTESGAVIFGPHPDGLPQPAESLGYPHPEVQLRLVDGKNMDADEGVLQVKCPALMLGYYKAPELTAAAMTKDGYYITGDVVRRDRDGFHYFVGRADDMFVCGGENVFPGDVEAMLERHPGIQRACVVPVDDPIKGKKPVALVVLREGARLSEQEVKDYALANGPSYQHPRAVYIVDALPVGGVDKIDRKEAFRLVASLAGGGVAAATTN